MNRILPSILFAFGLILVAATIAQNKTTIEKIDWSARVKPLEQDHYLLDTAYNIWCGSVVQAGNKKFYMVYSRWPKSKGHEAWITHSELALAVSDKPAGPYKHLKVVLPSRGPSYWDGICTHNPVFLYRNGKYYLVYMGATGPVPEKPVLPYSAEWYVYRNSQRIGLAMADDPEGTWTRYDQPILSISSDSLAPDAMMVSNPAIAINDHDSVVMVYKQVGKNGTFTGGRVRYGVAFAPSLMGPYQKHPDPIFQPSDPEAANAWMLAEDPFIWYDSGKYYALVRDVTGRFTGDKGLAIFSSPDAVNWDPTPNPKFLPRTITWENGTVLDDKLERPWLLFRKQKPAFLFGSMGINNRKHAMNICLEIK